MRTNLLLAALMLSGAAFAQGTTAPIILKAPNSYYLSSISPNGKWACGNYRDGGEDSSYGFRWNLETGEIEMISSQDVSTAKYISDDGTIVGIFLDRTYNANGSKMSLAGYWKDKKWTRLELPNTNIYSSDAFFITGDGRYICGRVATSVIQYDGYVWEDGKILKKLKSDDKLENTPAAITPDGKIAVGYKRDKGRRGCIWEADGTVSWLTEYGSGAMAQAISPDGKKILYEGELGTDGNRNGRYAIKDIATRTDELVFPVGTNANKLYFKAISNKNTIMGYEDTRGYVWQDGKAYYADDYLISKGVDLASEHVFMTPETDYYQVYIGSAISADDNVMGFLYYNDDKNSNGDYSVSVQSMIVKFNQPTTGYAPTSIEASRVKGASSVLLTWKNNIAAKGITGYNVYRDGNKVNTELVTDMSYVDANVADGEHTYTLTTLYGDTESAKSESVTVAVSSALSAPSALYTAQYGYNSANILWNAPATNLGSLTYNDENAQVETFGMNRKGISYETAILFEPAKTKAYKGQKITAVGFNPLEAQGGWKINLYTYDENDVLKLLYSQPVTQELVFGQRNVVKLDVPQDIPAGDLVVATEVAVTNASPSINAMIIENAKNGYTDLLRKTTESNFYSLGDYYKSFGAIQEATWTMDVVFAPEGTDIDKENVDHYNIYADGSLVGKAQTCSYLAQNLSEGAHNLGVSAVLADGRETAATAASVNIANNEKALAGIDNVAVSNTSNTAINATWNAPVDNDPITLQYCSDKDGNNGMMGPSANNYNFMAATSFGTDKFKGRNGYALRSIRFYPTSDATFTALIYKNGEVVNETEIDDYKLNQWNEVTLSEPVIVDDKSTYMLAIDCYDVAPNTAPLACDDKQANTGVSDLYSLNGTTWLTTRSNSYTSYSWLMAINLDNPNSDVALPVSGYDVKIDGEKKNSDKITECSYAYDFGAEDAKEHTVQVDVYYTVKPESVSGGVTRFYIGAAGISENVIGKLSVTKGDNEITVTGNNVKSVDIISVGGATVASAKGDTVSINGLSSGAYIVKAVVDGKVVSKKIMIEK